MTEAIYKTQAPRYVEAGYWPRPITIGSKGSHLNNWQKPDPDWAEKTILGWQEKYAGERHRLHLNQ